MEKLKSGIIGQAQVVFGGAILVDVGTIGGNDGISIGLSELKFPTEAGATPSSYETYCGVQVSLAFPDIETYKNFRNILDEVELMLKKRIKNQKNGTEG